MHGCLVSRPAATATLTVRRANCHAIQLLFVLSTKDAPSRQPILDPTDKIPTRFDMSVYAVELADVHAAARRIAKYAHHTPVITCRALDNLAGRRVLFKCENLQKVGAFKFRGACNAVMKLAEDDAARGVATHSSGNHAQALALAARLRGIPSHIVMPSDAPAVKRAAVEGYGAQIVECEPTLEARESTAADVIAQTGATFIHPYDNPDVIAGQGTVALELLDEVPTLDAIVTPIGGGGMASGVCVAAKSIKSTIRIFSGEPTGADDAARSMAANRLIPQTSPQTIADGLKTSLGKLTWPIVRDHVERIFTVSDDATIEAMRFIWQRAKIIIEPSAAVAVAAVLSDEFKRLEGINEVAVVLSGGNVDLNNLPW